MSASGRQRVGAVVIGRNEGARLERCLESVLPRVAAAVYVDSDSSDGSAERAEAAGAEVIRLTDGRLTAARGRQAGLEHLLARHPELEFVQFIDGDCELRADWLSAAVKRLDEDPGLGAVCGRRREVRAAESFWSRVIDIDWESPRGAAAYIGGDSLCRVAALRAIGGWSVDLIAGEDPDLGFRLRDAGWRIERLGAEQTWHDIAMERFGAYWRRSVRAGHAYAEVGWRLRHGSGRVWLRRAASIVFYGAVLPLLTVAALFVTWPLALVGVALYARLGWALARYARERGATWGLAAAYAALNTVCKVAGAVGVARYALGRLSGRRSGLIEYKPAPWGGSAGPSAVGVQAR